MRTFCCPFSVAKLLTDACSPSISQDPHDRYLYVTATQQDLHFRQLFLLLSKAGMSLPRSRALSQCLFFCHTVRATRWKIPLDQGLLCCIEFALQALLPLSALTPSILSCLTCLIPLPLSSHMHPPGHLCILCPPPPPLSPSTGYAYRAPPLTSPHVPD